MIGQAAVASCLTQTLPEVAGKAPSTTSAYITSPANTFGMCGISTHTFMPATNSTPFRLSISSTANKKGDCSPSASDDPKTIGVDADHDQTTTIPVSLSFPAFAGIPGSGQLAVCLKSSHGFLVRIEPHFQNRRHAGNGGVAPCPLIMGYTPAVWQEPQWSLHKSSIEPDARATASALVQRVELSPHHIAQGVNHVVMASFLVRLALLSPALQL